MERGELRAIPAEVNEFRHLSRINLPGFWNAGAIFPECHVAGSRQERSIAAYPSPHRDSSTPFMNASKTGHPVAEVTAALLLTALVCAGFWTIFSQLEWTRSSAALWKYRESLGQGWWVSLVVSAGSLIGSCLVAAALVAGQRSGLRAVRWFTQGFVEIVRGMPLLSLVLIGFYVVLNNRTVSELLSRLSSLVGLAGTDYDLAGKLFAGILLLSIFTGAYLTEILRGGLDSIPHAQLDSARAVGFSRGQVMRYVVFPQALRRVLPALAGQFVSLVKDSSLLCVIGVNEFTYQARAFYAATYLGVEAFLPLAAGYLLLTLPIAAFAHWLERRFKAATAG